MSAIYRLAARRREIVEEIDKIKSMRKGTLNTRYNKVTNKKGEEVLNGPYYVLTKKGAGNKTISEPVPATTAQSVQEGVENYKRFKQLADEYVEVCEKLSRFTDVDGEGKKN